VWVLQNERSGGDWHPDGLQGVSINRPQGAHRFEDRDEAEQVAAWLNGTVIHCGAAVFNDGWSVVEA
jgi:hypothetical protein